MKRLIGPVALVVDLTLSLTGCVVDVVAGDGYGANNRVEVTADFSRNVPVESQEGIRLVGVNGSIEVRGQSGLNQVRIEAVRRVRSHTRYDAEEHLHLLQVSVKVNSNDVLVETVQPKSSGHRTYQVDYIVTVPEDFWADVANANGSIRLADLRANAWVRNANGNVILEHLTGSSWVSLGNGDIKSSVHLPVGGKVVHAVGNGGVNLTVQPEVSATFGAQVGNGSISVSGLSFSQSVSGKNFVNGVLGTGSGVIDLSVGNGWIQARGG